MNLIIPGIDLLSRHLPPGVHCQVYDLLCLPHPFLSATRPNILFHYRAPLSHRHQLLAVCPGVHLDPEPQLDPGELLVRSGLSAPTINQRQGLLQVHTSDLQIDVDCLPVRLHSGLVSPVQADQ